MNQRLSRLCTLMQFSDSAFPVGTFSFSNGLETAQFEGIGEAECAHGESRIAKLHQRAEAGKALVHDG